MTTQFPDIWWKTSMGVYKDFGSVLVFGGKKII
jgi:hypothetical protein